MAIARLDLLFQQEDVLLRQLLSSNSHLLGVAMCEEARAVEHRHPLSALTDAR